MRRIVLFIIIVAFSFSCRRELQERKDDFIYIGKKETLHSSILNEDRPYWVYVPPYNPKSGKKFPVLYLLDGDAHFHSVSGLIQILGTGVNGTNVIPDMIVVAIPNTKRTRDLTPSHSETMDGQTHDFLKESGGGNNFMKFVSTELIPHIEKLYPTHPYRVLVGHSFGGIAAINALYTTPETFDAYVAIDPSFWWDKRLLLKKADSVFSTQKFNNKYLFLAQANTLSPGESTNDHYGAIKDYAKVLESPANTSGIRWSYKYYPDDSHGSVPFISEYDGLRFVFTDFYKLGDVGLHPDSLVQHFAQYRLPTPEGVINDLGYTALGRADLALAQRFFQMNIEAYPLSANVYDSMGELLLTKGDSAMALKNYEKSLELDPANDNAKRIIKELKSKR